jgi:hypothetical protein
MAHNVWFLGSIYMHPSICHKAISHMLFWARASPLEIFLSSLQREFFSTLLETIAARGPALTHARVGTDSSLNYKKFPTAINPNQSHTA